MSISKLFSSVVSCTYQSSHCTTKLWYTIFAVLEKVLEDMWWPLTNFCLPENYKQATGVTTTSTGGVGGEYL